MTRCGTVRKIFKTSMDLGLENLVKILLPTLCIFSTFQRPSDCEGFGYHQTFGSDDYFLDLSFSTNPNGLIQKQKKASGRVRFKGVLASSDRERSVVGYFERRGSIGFYYFKIEGHGFVGRLKSVDGRCEPRLEFDKTTGGPVQGGMNAGFCI